MEDKRVFLAIPITPSEGYVAVYERLKHRLRMDMISWIEPGIAHLTLKFFGKTSDARIESIIKSIRKGVSEQQGFDFVIDKMGAFGSSHSPKVIWFGVEHPEKINELHQQIMKHIRGIGYFPDPGNFVPHITLARVKKCDDKQWFWKSLEEHQNKDIQPVSVDKIVLYESILQPKGAIHHVIEEFPLKSY